MLVSEQRAPEGQWHVSAVYEFEVTICELTKYYEARQNTVSFEI